MHPQVHEYLDGELPREALSTEALAELTEWESLQDALHARRSETAPPWLADDVMRALPVEGAGWWQRGWRWLVTPRPLYLPPLAPLGAAAALAALLFAGIDRTPPAAPVALQDQGVIYVQFALDAEGARSVAVAGDFNDWSAENGLLRDADGDGTWTGLIAVQPGVHKYMFVVNGEEWVTDPVAASYVDDGFGMKNALLAVSAPEARS